MVLMMSVFEPEIEPVCHRMIPFERSTLFGRTLLRGVLGRNETLATSGIVGKVEAAMFTQRLLDIYPASHVIMLGGAGALDPSISIGQVILGSAFQEYDRILPAPFQEQVFQGSPVNNLILTEYPKLMTGKIISGDELVQSCSRRDQLRKDYDAIGLDMDSAAIAKVCAMNEVPFVALKVALDYCDEKTQHDYESAFSEHAGLPASIIVDFLCKHIMRA